VGLAAAEVRREARVAEAKTADEPAIRALGFLLPLQEKVALRSRVG